MSNFNRITLVGNLTRDPECNGAIIKLLTALIWSNLLQNAYGGKQPTKQEQRNTLCWC